MKTNKIQALLISHLNRHGHIELILPDGVLLEIGINQENKKGDLVIKDNYCWVIAKREDRAASLDSYNLGLRFTDSNTTIVFDDRYIDMNGESVRQLEVI